MQNSAVELGASPKADESISTFAHNPANWQSSWCDSSDSHLEDSRRCSSKQQSVHTAGKQSKQQPTQQTHQPTTTTTA